MLFFVLFFTFLTLVKAEFWTTTMIEPIEFDSECIAATNCMISMSSFFLNVSSPEIQTSKVNQWPIVQMNEKMRYLSHWEFGDPEKLTLEMAIVMPVGSRPLKQLHFCDDAKNVQLAGQMYEENFSSWHYILKGRCFNVSIFIEKHLGSICQTCGEFSSAQTNQQHFLELLLEQIKNPVVLVAIALCFCLLILVCTCICCCNRQRSNKNGYPINISPDSNSSVKPMLVKTRPSPATTSATYVNSCVYRKQECLNQLPSFLLNSNQSSLKDSGVHHAYDEIPVCKLNSGTLVDFDYD